MELQQLEIGGAPAPYRLAGKGAPLVLVHGLAGSGRWWSQVCAPLAERRRVYVPDLPRLRRRLGVADLTAWLGRWLQAAELERIDLVGHSLGGLVAAELAAKQPARVRRLALVAPAGIPCGRGLLSRSLHLLETLYDVRGQLPTIMGDGVRAGPLGLLRGAVYVSSRDLRAELASVRAPALIVWGKHDRLIPTRIAEEWQRALPTSRLVFLPCGHVPMWEAPEELAAHLLAFLEEQLPDEPSDERRPGVVRGVRLAGDDQQSATG